MTNYTGTGIILPFGITSGPDGALWFTNADGPSIGRITDLAMTTSSLPNATVGAHYSKTLSATGGNPPYTWKLTSGRPPRAGLASRSWNCTLDEVTRASRYDAAYSVSVIEHLKAEHRRELIAEIAARVRPGGLVVLTIDLVRNGDELWNRNRGLEVEEPSRHGTITDVTGEAAASGLELFRIERERGWGDTPVDIGLLAMRRTTPPTALAETVRRGLMFADRVVAGYRRRRPRS